MTIVFKAFGKWIWFCGRILVWGWWWGVYDMTLRIAIIVIMILVGGLIFLRFIVIVIVVIDKIKASFKIGRIIFGNLIRNGIAVLICVLRLRLVLRVWVISIILISWLWVELLPAVRHFLVIRPWIALSIHLRTTLRAVTRWIGVVAILAWRDIELLDESSWHELFPDGNLAHFLGEWIVIGTIWIVILDLRTVLQLKALSLFYRRWRLVEKLLGNEFITQLSRWKTFLHILILLLEILKILFYRFPL